MDKEIHRRDCLKSIGAAGIGSLALSGNGLADQTNLRDRFDVLSGDDERRVVKLARRREVYDELKRAVTTHKDVVGNGNVVETGAVRVYLPDGSEMEVAKFKFKTPRENARATVEIPIDIDAQATGSVVTAPDDFKTNGGTPRVSLYRRSSAVTTSELHKFDEVKMVTSSVYQANVDWPNIACEGCKGVVGVVNAVGCSLTSTAACGIITSETGVGPFACAAAYATACFIVFTLGVSNPTKVCETGGNGPCA